MKKTILPFSGPIRQAARFELLAYLLMNGPVAYPNGNGNQWVEGITGFAEFQWMLRSNGLVYWVVSEHVVDSGSRSNGRSRTYQSNDCCSWQSATSPINYPQSVGIKNPAHAFVVAQPRPRVQLQMPSSPVSNWARIVIGAPKGQMRGEPAALRSRAIGKRVFFPRTFEEDLDADLFDRKVGTISHVADNWILASVGACSGGTDYQEKLSAACSRLDDDRLSWMLGEWFFDCDGPLAEPSALMRIWIDVIRQPLIPYSVEERRQQPDTHSRSSLLTSKISTTAKQPATNRCGTTAALFKNAFRSASKNVGGAFSRMGSGGQVQVAVDVVEFETAICGEIPRQAAGVVEHPAAGVARIAGRAHEVVVQVDIRNAGPRFPRTPTLADFAILRPRTRKNGSYGVTPLMNFPVRS